MKKWHYPFLAFLLIATFFILRESRQKSSGTQAEYRTASGMVFGTRYNATYRSDRDLQAELEQAMNSVGQALSMFDSTSTISMVNRADSIQVSDPMFLSIMRRAMEISESTGGAFDITVAPAVNAWGFGFKKANEITDAVIDSLKEITGYWKIHEKDGFITKDDARIMLDCSAIAKGYGSDVAAMALRENGVTDYMIEIGGEIVLSGRNPKGTFWNIGISKPIDDSLALNTELDTILSLTDIAMATSGNYRNFYIVDGKKYAHTIDPHTCRPVSHSLLSATILAPDCATADAYATAMMVMGADSALAVLERHPELRAFLIVEGADGTLQTLEH